MDCYNINYQLNIFVKNMTVGREPSNNNNAEGIFGGVIMMPNVYIFIYTHAIFFFRLFVLNIFDYYKFRTYSHELYMTITIENHPICLINAPCKQKYNL